MKNKDFYSWKVIYPDGRIYDNKSIKLKDLKSPFRFEMTPLENHLQKFAINVKIDQELIYFRRVFGKINMCTEENIIKDIWYCLGYKKDNFKSVLWINPITQKQKIQLGNNIELKVGEEK